jgi:TonB-linked SusC/RagA family outer membrane protein
MPHTRRAVPWALALALLTGASAAQAQEREITGRVVRAGTTEGVANAAIVPIAPRRGRPVFTDAQGRFRLTVPTGPVRLEVRAPAYLRQEVEVPAGRSTVEVALQPDIFRLEDLVVTGQVTTIERRSATTSIAYVPGNEVSRVPQPSVIHALAGRVTGVNLQSNSGAPGGGIQIQIRGANTLLGNFEPLIVVDGVIYSNASIPGGRGFANRAASPSLEGDPVNRLADLNPEDIASIEILKGAAASSIYGAKAANGVVVITTNRGRAGAPQGSFVQRVGWNRPLRKLTFRRWTRQEALNEIRDPRVQEWCTTDPCPYYDNFGAIYGQRKPSYESFVSVRGGAGNTRYYISGTLAREEGIERRTGAGRRNLRLNLDQNFGSAVDLRVTSSFTRSDNDRGWNNNCNNYACHIYALAYIPSFVDLTRKNPDGTYPRPTFWVQSNPVQLAELAVNHEETNRFTGGVQLGWNVLATDRHSLRVVVGGGTDWFAQANNVWSPNELFSEQVEALPGESVVSEGRSLLYNGNLNAVHTWTLPFGSLTSSAGVQYEFQQLYTNLIRSEGLLPGQRNVNRGVQITAQEELQRVRTAALYLSEQLRLWEDRALLQTGFRAERASVNGDPNRYFLYPNVSLSYRFLDLFGEGNELKLRAAYGETGNQPRFGQKFTALTTPQLGGIRGLAVSTVAGYDRIEPERLKEVEVGMDGLFLQGRVTWEVTYYQRNTTNLLLQRAPAPSTGFSVQTFNGGKIRNAGVEAALGLTPVRSRRVEWVARTTFTAFRSRVVDLAGLPPFFPTGSGFGNLGRTRIEKGKSITQIVGFRLNEDGTRGATLEQLGDANPDFRMGFAHDVTVGALAFNLLVDWQKGGNVINLTRFLMDDGRTSPDWGSPAWQRRYQGYRVGAIQPYIERATFVKLRELGVNVRVPDRWTARLGGQIRDLRVGLVGRNLAMWTPYSGLDPEVSNFGNLAVRGNLDIGPYPPSRSLFLNVSFGF